MQHLLLEDLEFPPHLKAHARGAGGDMLMTHQDVRRKGGMGQQTSNVPPSAI